MKHPLVLTTAVCAVLFGNAASVTADRPERPAKRPWEWSTEERLADRFNPDKISERETAYETKFPQARGGAQRARAESYSSDGRKPLVYGIDGSRNPELFFRYELFDLLLSGFDPDESTRSRQRASLRSAIKSLGYDDDVFWTRLESVAAQYLPLRFGAPVTGVSEVQAAMEVKCRGRYEALQAARKLFGSRELDLVLYTVMAPVSSMSEATFDADPGAKHRIAEAGCR